MSKSIATLTGHNVPDMPDHQRKRVAAWVRTQAAAIEDLGHDWAKQERRIYEEGERRLILTVYEAAEMTERNRKGIAKWLHKVAEWIVKAGSDVPSKYMWRI